MEGGGEGTKSKDLEECSSSPAPSLKKGPWTAEEDAILIEHVRNNGEGNWNSVQRSTSLARCGKSCRLRWANHLRPNLKKGQLTPEEELLVLRLHAQLGNKWARMAAQLPGRTDNEIKNYWNTRVKRRQRAGMPLYPPIILQCHRPPPLLIPSSSTSTAAEVPREAKRAREDYGMMMFRFPMSPASSFVPGIWHTAPSTPTGRTMFDYSIRPPMTPPMPPSACSPGIEMLTHSSSSHVMDGGGEVELMDKLLLLQQQEERAEQKKRDHHAFNWADPSGGFNEGKENNVGAGGEAFLGLEELDCSTSPFPTNYSESNHLWIGEITTTAPDWNNGDSSDISNGGRPVLTNDHLTVDQHQLGSSSPTLRQWNQTGTSHPAAGTISPPDWNITSCHWNNMPELV